MRPRDIPWGTLGGLALVMALITGIVLVVRGGQRVPDELQPIAWHRQSCAHCQMLIGEPAHAAQLITADGEVLGFDDPGCALRYLDERHPIVHRMWFHHGTSDRWLPSTEVRFTTGATTPMGFGLLAVDRGTPGAIDLAAASEHVGTSKEIAR